MPIDIQCRTTFDITRTDTRGNFRQAQMPTTDRAGQTLVDNESWARSRNQQRNFETILQILSLRALPEDISDPRLDSQDHSWTFSFRIPDPASVAWGADPVGALRFDADGVPMIRGLGEQASTLDHIRCYGPEANIWFDLARGK